MGDIDQLLAIKTRLTTIKGYAQLIARERHRAGAPSSQFDEHVSTLNGEIDRLIDFVRDLEGAMTGGRGAKPTSTGDLTGGDVNSDDGYASSAG